MVLLDGVVAVCGECAMSWCRKSVVMTSSADICWYATEVWRCESSVARVMVTSVHDGRNECSNVCNSSCWSAERRADVLGGAVVAAVAALVVVAEVECVRWMVVECGGSWRMPPACEFSLSSSGSAVAVAGEASLGMAGAVSVRARDV